ncbi:NAD-dependent epimerase/dehydratase family protein [Rhodoplanes sp. SY1]|uniref:NAD-dependent epimerase/dehydratase family protein n=1 Tax=Rhodoplanes sp. SY1 TaxID=3166646 RepID=UPI0038B456CA
MTTLICFGFGYSAQHWVAVHGGRFDRIVGTTRTAESAADHAARHYGGREVEVLVFDGTSASAELTDAVREADAILISAPPTETGDPVLAVLGDAIAAAAQAGRLQSIVLLSTLGVYGDHGGAWVDETAELRPVGARNKARVEQEAAWMALGARTGVPVASLRLAGIYGPGQDAIVNMEKGRAWRIVRPGQVFNRIHVVDIAQAIEAAFDKRAHGAFNVADDEPTPPGDPVVFAAELLGREPPPEWPFEEAVKHLPPMAASFYAECKRAKTDKLKRELGVTLRYPTYREGLRADFAARQSH